MLIKRIKNIIRNMNYLSKHSLWDDHEEMIVYITNKILDDVSYEYNIDYPGKKKLQILDTDETLSLIEKGKNSFIRTGDGEIKLMMGYDHPFQKYNKKIADILINALEQPRNNLLIGINRNYFIPLIPKENPKFYRRNAYELRNFYLKHCKESVTYIDASCIGFRAYNGSKNELIKHYERWRNLFKNRDIVIVCGEGILDSFEYDVFELAKSKEFIYGPKTNAWSQHDYLIDKILNTVAKNKVLVFILGQAGKAMMVELSDMGYKCWDVGHLAKYYNAIMTNMEWNEKNISKFYAPD